MTDKFHQHLMHRPRASCLSKSFNTSSVILQLHFTPTPSGTDSSQRFLLIVLKVSKAWNTVGTKMLYSRPFLISHWRVQSFARTLASNLSLGRLVKDVYVLFQSRHIYATKVSDTQMEALDIVTRFDLIRALRLCPSLQTLAISNRSRLHPVIYPVDKVFVDASRIGRRLRKLTIHGCPSIFSAYFRPILSEDASLPQLMTLCLREICIIDGFQFLLLRRLHTLQIAQSYRWPQNTDRVPNLTLSSAVMPMLTTLEVYENSFITRLDVNGMRRLRRYHCLGRPSVASFPDRNVTAILDGLRHLMTAGYLMEEYNKDNVQWHLLDRLESLVLVIDPQTQYALAGLRDLIMKTESDGRNIVSLTGLVLLADLSVPNQDIILSSPAFGDLRSLCTSRNINLQVDLSGLNDWITRRLVGQLEHSHMA
ncbi:unnamed protein product [Somion occarium]|uniref:F-box domain-containing protein n=1 Tax=Somion occarium TaxID=3059160 RepID=A0ABP1DEU8_9APHY